MSDDEMPTIGARDLLFETPWVRVIDKEIIAPGGGAPEITSRDVVLAAVGSWRPPPGGGDIHFADVHIAMESASAARAYVTVELTVPDRQTGQPTVDARDATASLAKRGGEWVITSAESKEFPAATMRP